MSMLVNLWNRMVDTRAASPAGLLLGYRVVDGRPTRKPLYMSLNRRLQHLVVLGKTGTGKTSFVKSMIEQDLKAGRGFLCIDFHGELTPFVLRKVSQLEIGKGVDLSDRLIVVDPSDQTRSAGINILNAEGRLIPVLVSEVVSVIKNRWQLESLGARTEELLRNVIWVLAENGMTLPDVVPFLTAPDFRESLVTKSSNPQVLSYFRRFDQMSDAMKVVVIEPVMNKITAFTSDPAVRHLLGQRLPPLNIRDSLEKGHWVVLSLSKGRLGENAVTIAALILAHFKNVAFARRSKALFSVYGDEIHGLVSSAEALGTLLAESRKLGISVVTANQYLAQHPPQVRSALFSAGTIISFRCSSEDAARLSQALGRAESVANRLRELPPRFALCTDESSGPVEMVTKFLLDVPLDYRSLKSRITTRWTRPRSDIETELANEQVAITRRREVLENWK